MEQDPGLCPLAWPSSSHNRAWRAHTTTQSLARESTTGEGEEGFRLQAQIRRV